MADDTLRVLTQVDVNGIRAGMSEASSAVQAETERMNEGFRTTVTESEKAFSRVNYSSVEARHAIHGLGEEIGIHVPRFVQTFVAELGGVGPLMAAAFTPIAVAGLVEVLIDAGKKVYDFYEDVVNLKSAFEAVEQAERQFTDDQIALSNALVAGQVHLSGLAGGPVVEAKARLGSLGDEIVDLGKMLDKSGKSFTDLGVSARASIREFLKPVAAKDLEETLQKVGFEVKRLKSLLLNTDDEDSTDFKELQGSIQLLSSFYDTLALKVQKYKQEQSTASAEVQRAIKDEADKKARAEEQAAHKEEQAAKQAEAAFHARTIAEIRDASEAAKEKTRILAEEAKANAEWYKKVDAEEKELDREIARTQEEQLRRAIEMQNKEFRAREEQLAKEVELENRAFHRITDDINKNVVSWINGQETFGLAAEKVFTGLADDAISNVLKIGEKWVVQHVLMGAVSKLFHVQDTASELAAITAKIAALKSFGAAQVGLAGTSGVASMAAAPFPIDTTAPAFGASMAASAAGFLAFEAGGIMPNDGPALLHANEMVLPAHISQPLQEAASQGTLGGGGSPTFHFNHYGPGTDSQVRDSSKEFMRVANRELRRQGLPKVKWSSGRR